MDGNAYFSLPRRSPWPLRAPLRSHRTAVIAVVTAAANMAGTAATGAINIATVATVASIAAIIPIGMADTREAPAMRAVSATAVTEPICATIAGTAIVRRHEDMAITAPTMAMCF